MEVRWPASAAARLWGPRMLPGAAFAEAAVALTAGAVFAWSAPAPTGPAPAPPLAAPAPTAPVADPDPDPAGSPSPSPTTVPSRTGRPAATPAARPKTTTVPSTTPAAPKVTPGYRLLYTDALGRTARLNPCSPVKYQLNLSGAPARAADDVHEAVRRVADATGITFSFAGTTTAQPLAGRGAVRGSDGTYPPLLFAWATPSTTNLLPTGWSGNDVNRVDGPDGPVIVSATVVLDASRNADVVSGFAPGLSRGALLLHELGHAAGLADSANPVDLMYEAITEKEVAWSAADRAGLKAVGAGAGCLTVP